MRIPNHWLVTSAVAIISSLGACSTTADGASRSLAIGKATTLSQGDVRMLPGGGRLEYLGMMADSRCPPDVQCIWAGDAEASFSHVGRDGSSRKFSLHTTLEPRSVALDAGTLTLESVDRAQPPKITLRLSQP